MLVPFSGRRLGLCSGSKPPTTEFALLFVGWFSAKLFPLMSLDVLISEMGRKTCRDLYKIITEKLMKKLGIPSLWIAGGVGGEGIG